MSAAIVAAVLMRLFAGAGAQGDLVVHKTGTKEYHRPGCAVIRDGQEVLALTRGQAESRGLSAHDCDPLPPTPGKPAKPAPPTSVYVDGGKHYHKEKCVRLGRKSKKLELDEAGRKYWPCPACKPPIRKRPG